MADDYSSVGSDDLVDMTHHNRLVRRVPEVENDTVDEAEVQADDGELVVDLNTPENQDFTGDVANDVSENSEVVSPESKTNGKSTGTASSDVSPAGSDSKGRDDNKTASGSQSDGQQPGQRQQKKSKQKQQQQPFKLVDQDNKQFSSSGEFTEEQLVKMYRQMQADRARTKQLLNHVTSPYSMHGSVGESAAMAAGAFMGFALGRTMYKVSRIGHLRQDWRLRREVLRQERGYYNQGSSNRFGGLLQGFSNAAGSFAKGFRRGTRKDIDMDARQQQSAEKVEVKAAEETPASESTAEQSYGMA